MPNGPFGLRPMRDGLLPPSHPTNSHQQGIVIPTGPSTRGGRYGNGPQQQMGPSSSPPQYVTYQAPDVTFTAVGDYTIAWYGERPPASSAPAYTTYPHPPAQYPQYADGAHHPNNAHARPTWAGKAPSPPMTQQAMGRAKPFATEQQHGSYESRPPIHRLPFSRSFRPGDRDSRGQRDSAYFGGPASLRIPDDVERSDSSATAVPPHAPPPVPTERSPPPAPTAAPHTLVCLSATAASFIPTQYQAGPNNPVANPEIVTQPSTQPSTQRADPWQLAVLHTSDSELPRPHHDAKFKGLHKLWDGAPTVGVDNPGFPHILSCEASARGNPEVILGAGAGVVAQGWCGKVRVILDEIERKPDRKKSGLHDAVQGQRMGMDTVDVAIGAAEQVLSKSPEVPVWEERDTNKALREWEEAAGLR